MIRFALIVLLSALGVSHTCAQSRWPDRSVRFIVPFPAGSATDIVARLVAQRLGAKLNQQFVVDNRAGASGALGTEAVARAAPDGYTIGLATTSTHVLAVSLNPNLSYDPVTNFAPIGMIGSAPYVLAVSNSVPAKSIAELVALAKAKPKSLNYASAGPASMAHLAGALFETLTGADWTHVPYRSSAQAVLDVVEGRIEMQFGTIAPTLPHITEGKMRALGVTSAQRLSLLPDVPTIAEGGVPGYEASLWMAIVAPAATPAEITGRLNGLVNEALGSEDLKKALRDQGVEAEPGTREALVARIPQDVAKWRRVVTQANIKPE
jgi:tripartite-type tricarboxylate transporter receptor subunit TctC